MAIKTASVRLEGGGLRFEGSTGSGHRVVVDNAEGDTGPRPAELVPLALAGCTAMDVISILRKKRQAVDRYEVRAAGEQVAEHPNQFQRFAVVHVVQGTGIDREALRRAIELSATRYCSVGATLSGGPVEVEHSYELVDADTGTTEAAVVVVIGPSGVVREPTLA